MSSGSESDCSDGEHNNADVYVDRSFEVLDHMIMSEVNALVRYVKSPEKFRREITERRADLEGLTENCGMPRTIGALRQLQSLLASKFVPKKPAATTSETAHASSEETKDPSE